MTHLDAMAEEVLRTNLMWTQALIDEIGDDPDLINRIIANYHRRCLGPESEAVAMEMMEQIGVGHMVEIGTKLAEAMSASKSEADRGGRRFFPHNPHGGAGNPHTADPNGNDTCIQCGRRRLPDDEERWQEFADIPRATPKPPKPLTEKVLRRAPEDATVGELRHHLDRMERVEKVAPPGDELAKLNSEIGWVRKLIAEREQSEDKDA